MRDHDALDNNPLVSRNALELLHEELYGWSLSRTGYDRSAAEDLMQQAYVELLSGRARYDAKTDTSRFSLTLIEGRKRQIRRACEALGHPVVRLVRLRMGPLELGRLPAGAARPLTGGERGRLLRLRDGRG